MSTEEVSRAARHRRASLEGARLDRANEGANERFVKRHRKMGATFTAALVLFTVGSLMIYFGTLALPVDRDRGLSMLVVGAIAFLPGSYATFQLYGAWRRWPGYSYDALPSYDEAWFADEGVDK